MYYIDICFISLLVLLPVISAGVYSFIDEENTFWVFFGIFWGILFLYLSYIFYGMTKEGKKKKKKKN